MLPAAASMIQEYGNLLRHDAVYAAKAARITDLTHDIAQLLRQRGTSSLLQGKLSTRDVP